jgi:hypothetical protein
MSNNVLSFCNKWDVNILKAKSNLPVESLQFHQVNIFPMQVTSRRPGLTTGEGETNLKDLNSNLMSDMVEKVRTQVSNLQLFIDTELTFAVKTYFRSEFCRLFAREGVFVAYFKYFLEVAKNLCSDAGAIAANEKSVPPILLLLLSRYLSYFQVSPSNSKPVIC